MKALVNLAVATLLLLPGCGKCAGDHKDLAATNTYDASPSVKRSATPRLVVLVVVDQMASWSFERDRSLVREGIRRLLDQGVFVPRAEYPYANTYTAPGHAALATGAVPAITGILANGWYLRDKQNRLEATDDASHPTLQLIPNPGNRPASSGSPRHLLVSGIADVLRETRPNSKSITISLKDRSAILAAGKRPNLAIWLDDVQGVMSTSTFYADKAPPWLQALADQGVVAAELEKTWQPLDAKLLAQVTELDDDAIGEGGAYGLDTTFPHSLKGLRASVSALRLTPMGTELLFTTARAAVEGEQLGADDDSDYLVISVSSHDYAGHYWGQESWERLDLFLRIDQSLGEFMTYLDGRLGKDGYALVLASDHGATPMVELSQKAGLDAHRVSRENLIAVADRAARKVLGKKSWVFAYAASTLYFTPAFFQQPQAKQTRALAEVVKSVRGIKGVGYVAVTDDIVGNCDQREGQAMLACRSVLLPGSGAIFVAPSARSHISGAEYSTGTSHGTPADEDRFVPLIFYIPGQAPRTIETPVSTLQIAPTLAKLLNLPPPPSAALPALPDL